MEVSPVYTNIFFFLSLFPPVSSLFVFSLCFAFACIAPFLSCHEVVYETSLRPPPPSPHPHHALYHATQSTKSKINKFIEDNSLGINALINVAIVGSVAFGAFFEIIEVDSDISAGWTWYEILRNIPQDNLQAYQQAVFDHPLPVKAMTSGVAYTLGDFTCQLSQGKTITTVDLKRSVRSGVAGFMIHGPLCHYWLRWTEDSLSFGGAWFATPVKVFADQTAWSLFLNSAYTTCIMSLQGMAPMKIKGEIEATWYNAISAGWKFWPFVHVLTFSSVIPQDFKLLFVDCVEVIWVTILSAAVNRDKEKALQVPLNAETEMPAVQLQEQLENEFSISVNGVEADFSEVKDFLPSVDERVGASDSGSLEETNILEHVLGGRGDDATQEEVEQRAR